MDRPERAYLLVRISNVVHRAGSYPSARAARGGRRKRRSPRLVGAKGEFIMKVRTFLAWSIGIFSIAFLAPDSAFAHCDSLDGPVVKAAQKALDTQNVDLVLVWGRPEDESEIRIAFNKTLAVRTLGQMAKELADRYFYETVVRLHRAGEGAPYTGLKPAGRDLGQAIPAAD